MNRASLILSLSVAMGVWSLPLDSHAQSARREASVPEAVSWVIADTTSGVVLDSFNAAKRVQIGSITKVATAMVVLDWAAAEGADLGQLATVPASVTALSSPNSIGLQPGDQISLREALYAALMQSDNQAAETLAVHVGKALGGNANDRDAATYFVSQMNALARKLGMNETRFLNAHGLDDLESKLPYSTGSDLTKLVNYALQRSGFTFYTSQKERKVSWQTTAGEPVTAMLKNTNELLGSDNVDGVKTGNTRRAGPCVAISASQRPESRLEGEKHVITPRRLTVIVLGSPQRFQVGKNLLARGWSLFDRWAAAGRPAKGWRADASTL